MFEAGDHSKDLAAKAYQCLFCSTNIICIYVQAQMNFTLGTTNNWFKDYDNMGRMNDGSNTRHCFDLKWYNDDQLHDWLGRLFQYSDWKDIRKSLNSCQLWSWFDGWQ